MSITIEPILYKHRKQRFDDDCITCQNTWPCEQGMIERWHPYHRALQKAQKHLLNHRRKIDNPIILMIELAMDMRGDGWEASIPPESP